MTIFNFSQAGRSISCNLLNMLFFPPCKSTHAIRPAPNLRREASHCSQKSPLQNLLTALLWGERPILCTPLNSPSVHAEGCRKVSVLKKIPSLPFPSLPNLECQIVMDRGQKGKNCSEELSSWSFQRDRRKILSEEQSSKVTSFLKSVLRSLKKARTEKDSFWRISSEVCHQSASTWRTYSGFNFLLASKRSNNLDLSKFFVSSNLGCPV